MIGFDIVDLEEANSTKHKNDERFIERILCTEERDIFSEFEEENLIWVCWSIKESAYKATPAKSQELFRPLRYKITSIKQSDNKIEAEVQFEKFHFKSIVEVFSDRILTISVINGFTHRKVNFSKEIYRDYHYLSSGKPVLIGAINNAENISVSHHGRYTGMVVMA